MPCNSGLMLSATIKYLPNFSGAWRRVGNVHNITPSRTVAGQPGATARTAVSYGTPHSSGRSYQAPRN